MAIVLNCGQFDFADDHIRIDWEDDHSGSYSPGTGRDQFGNTYRHNASMETVWVTLADGRTGAGWNEQEALESAVSKEVQCNEALC